MGLINSASTVTVQAFLTDAGKKKLYNSIENNSSGFITKFALGDSDTNYAAIALGSSALASGHVPEACEFKPKLRSSALYQGQYRPGIPALLINEDYGPELWTTISIGANLPINLIFNITTEWPKNSTFVEDYKLVLENPGNMTDAAFSSLFTISRQTNGAYSFNFTGNASLDVLQTLIGENQDGETTIQVKVIGKTTNQSLYYNIEVRR